MAKENIPGSKRCIFSSGADPGCLERGGGGGFIYIKVFVGGGVRFNDFISFFSETSHENEIIWSH